jgi:cytidylate kinase
MQNILSHYMRERMEKSAAKGPHKEPGPVVTVSRSYGCPGKLIGQELVHALNKKLAAAHVKDHWRWISKEILEESAKELKLDKFVIKEAAHSHQKGIMTSLIQSLSNKFYPGDDKVKKTIADVIRTFAKEGKVVIVGRGGVSLTQEIKNSFHIKLEAPMEWRIQKVCEMYQLTPDEATKRILEIDYKRNKLREYYEGKKPDPWVFDIIFHLNRMTVDEIIETSVGILETRKFI